MSWSDLVKRAEKWAKLRADNEKLLKELEAARCPLQLEEWSSTHNRKERHYFLQDGGKQHGYQSDGAYLCGLNPELVSPELEAQILELLRPIWDVEPSA